MTTRDELQALWEQYTAALKRVHDTIPREQIEQHRMAWRNAETARMDLDAWIHRHSAE